MPRKIPQRDPVGAYQRKATAARRIGQNKQCACGEARPEALLAGSKPTICAACDRKRRGRPTEDWHHVAGKANDPTRIRVPVNDHRADLSVAQYDWPKQTRENIDGSPLLAAAGYIRGSHDTIVYVIENLLLGHACKLEILDAYLVAKLGRKWWLKADIKRFAPNP